MNFILLVGAGFSRNWGGWLGSEVFEYLLGCSEIDAYVRDLLWQNKNRGGFEDALAEVQRAFAQSPGKTQLERLTCFQSVIVRMFSDMDKVFANPDFRFEPDNDRAYQLRNFLVRFDAIFSLNQDLLLERHYHNKDFHIAEYRQWKGSQLPGIRQTFRNDGIYDVGLSRFAPEDPPFCIDPKCQPIFKLHGSTNWLDGEGKNLLVIGGAKAATINQHAILKWNQERFEEYLSRPHTRLMVIGYGFADDHINLAIRTAAKKGQLKIFILDPLGVDVIDKNRNAVIPVPEDLAQDLRPHLIGASRRGISEIFASGRIEHGKVLRFFEQ